MALGWMSSVRSGFDPNPPIPAVPLLLAGARTVLEKKMAIEDLGPFYDGDGVDITDQVLAQASGGNQGQTPGWRRKLEEDAERGKEAVKEAEAAKAELAAANRKTALIEAGVDMKTPLGKYFADTYQGAATVEAIKDAAGQIGLISAAQSPAVQEELATQDRIAAASQGASGSSADDSDEQKIANFKGTPEEFDAFMEGLGSKIDRSKDAVWQKTPAQALIPVT